MDYEKQAQDFLDKTNTTLDINFSRWDYYFEDDKEKRDIYKVTMKRNNQVYEFEFGQSIFRSGTWILDPKIYHVIKTTRDEKEIKTGIWKRKLPKKPTAYDILACLTKHNPGTFKDFCLDFGYDNDSIKAKKVYDAVVQEYLALSNMFSQEELKEMAEIQ